MYSTLHMYRTLFHLCIFSLSLFSLYFSFSLSLSLPPSLPLSVSVSLSLSLSLSLSRSLPFFLVFLNLKHLRGFWPIKMTHVSQLGLLSNGYPMSRMYLEQEELSAHESTCLTRITQVNNGLNKRTLQDK